MNKIQINGRIKIIKIFIVPTTIPVNTSGILRTTNPKIYMEQQKTPHTQRNFKNKVGGSVLPDTKLYYKATVINAVWHWHKDISILESPEINPHAVGLQQRRQEHTTEQGQDSLFSKWCRENGRGTCKTVILDHFLIPYRKVISKWIQDKGKT